MKGTGIAPTTLEYPVPRIALSQHRNGRTKLVLCGCALEAVQVKELFEVRLLLRKRQKLGPSPTQDRDGVRLVKFRIPKRQELARRGSRAEANGSQLLKRSKIARARLPRSSAELLHERHRMLCRPQLAVEVVGKFVELLAASSLESDIRKRS